MNEIRVTYTGLISFATGIVSIFTGLLFTIIITRELSPQEFGTWGLIGNLTTYVFVLEPIVSYWTIRTISRGNFVGRTSILSNTMFSIGAIPIYLIIVLLFGTQANVNQEILFIAAMLIPVRFIRHTLTAINLGHRPQTIAYSLIIFEFIKIIFAFVLIYFLQLGLTGVILTVFFATLGSIIFSLIRSLDQIKDKFNIKYLKKWIKLFWIPVYPRFGDIFLYSDVVVFTIIVGNVENIAYWAAALTIGSIVLHAGKIETAVYPKLLQTKDKEHFNQNISRIFYFILPLTGMAIIFSESGLYVLNPIYSVATPLVISLTFLSVSQILGNIFSRSLGGLEEIDLYNDAKFKDYLKSKLFFLPTIRIIQRIGYLLTLVIFLIIFSSNFESDIELVYVWSLIAVLTHIPYTAYLYILVRKNFKPKIDKSALGKYFFATLIAFGSVFLLMDNYLEYNVSVIGFLSHLLPYVVFSLGIYFGITFLIDSKTRTLVKSVMLEFKNKK